MSIKKKKIKLRGNKGVLKKGQRILRSPRNNKCAPRVARKNAAAPYPGHLLAFLRPGLHGWSGLAHGDCATPWALAPHLRFHAKAATQASPSGFPLLPIANLPGPVFRLWVMWPWNLEKGGNADSKAFWRINLNRDLLGEEILPIIVSIFYSSSRNSATQMFL